MKPYDTRRSRPGWSSISWGVLLLCPLTLLSCSSSREALDDSRCEQALHGARESYLNAAFDEAVEGLRPCLSSGSDNQRMRAYYLMGMAQYQLDRQQEAEDMVRRLLELNPAFAADPSPPPGFEPPPPSGYIALIGDVRRTLPHDEAGGWGTGVKIALGAGGAGAVAGVLCLTGVICSDGGDGKGGLPEPPPLPISN